MSTSNPTTNEVIKRLIRVASDLVRKLDSAFASVKSCQDLFSPELVDLRQQLSQLCSKSLAADPSQCRRRAEELLWRKCFYNVISVAKTQIKKSHLTQLEMFYLDLHIEAGVSRLTEHLVDACQHLHKNHSPPEGPIKSWLHYQPLHHFQPAPTKVVSQESKEELVESAQRVLVWLGDLARYKIDLGLNTDLVLAQRFYQQALIINPSNGLPYNQLGTLLSNYQLHELESIAFYIKSMKAPKPFPGAEANLRQLLERMQSNGSSCKANLCSFLLKVIGQREDSANELGRLCQLIIASVQEQLQKSEEPDLSEIMGLVVVVVLISGLESASGYEAVAALGCSLLSLILTKLQTLLPLDGVNLEKETSETAVGEDEEDEDELKRARIRRRRAKLSCSSSSSEEDDISDDDLFLEDDASDSSESDVEREDSSVPPADSGFPLSEQWAETPPSLQPLLPIMIVLTVWLQTNEKIVILSAQSAFQLWNQMAVALNSVKKIKRCDITDDMLSQPLPEDWHFYGFYKKFPVDFNASETSFDDLTSTAVRIERLLRFGQWLSSTVPEAGFKFQDGSFSCDKLADPAPSQSKKDAMMRNMATLWLKSEVQDLEDKLGGKSPKKMHPRAKGNRQRNQNRKPSTSEVISLPYVYIVVDALALTEHQPLVKRLVKNRKWIVVVPSIVISELDQLKKESPAVRDCIRWLETSFRKGNRFVRGQRPNEHKTIPLMTYPKRKDKSSWILFQILECCHYLDSQQREVYRNSQEAPIVLLLSGQLGGEQDHQIKGICQSIGIDVTRPESIATSRAKTANKC